MGAYGGRRDIMAFIAPQGPIYQAGTLSGNPLAMAAGIATLTQLKATGFYESLDEKTEWLSAGLTRASEKAGIPVKLARAGSMLGLFFTDTDVKDFKDAKTSDLNRFSTYYKGMLQEGIYLAPSQFEALFVSAAHDRTQIDKTIQAAEKVMRKLKK